MNVNSNDCCAGGRDAWRADGVQRDAAPTAQRQGCSAEAAQTGAGHAAWTGESVVAASVHRAFLMATRNILGTMNTSLFVFKSI